MLFTALVLHCPWQVIASALGRGDQRQTGPKNLPSKSQHAPGMAKGSGVLIFLRDTGTESAQMSQLGGTRDKT